MCAKRMSLSEKIITLLNAVCEDAIDEMSAFLTYKELHKRVWHNKTGSQSLSKAINNIKRSGYLEVVEKDNQKAVRITNKGRLKLLQPVIDKQWDGRWRLVAFDIPEKNRKKRRGLRNALKSIGFIQMQKSLWICPYDVSEEIEKIIDLLDIEECVDYFIADAITNKDKYLNQFDLNM